MQTIIDNIKNVITVITGIVTLIAIRSPLWAILVWILHNPAWIVTGIVCVFAWWQWRMKRLYRADSYYNCDQAKAWQNVAKENDQAYEGLIDYIAYGNLNDALRDIFAYADSRNRYRTSRKAYRKATR